MADLPPAAAATAPPSTEQVRIQLHTRDPTIDIPPTGPILVSTSHQRYALSTLVNTLRDTADQPTPFSFLIDGRFLTTSLAAYLAAHGQSAETVLQVEYVLADLPPSPQATFEHDDWVASVDVLSASSPASTSSAAPLPGHERILSASYDGIARIWDLSGSVVASTNPLPPTPLPTHLLAARFLSPTTIATAGFDSHIRLYTLDGSATLTPSLSLLGHSHVITALSAPANNHFLSASADHTALLWPTALEPTHPVPTTLLSHIAGPPGAKRPRLARAGPAARLAHHTRPVSAAIFAPHDPSIAYTAAHDRQLLTWDLTTSALVSARTPAPHEPLTAAAALPRHPGVVVAGTGTGAVLVVDVREGARRAAVARGRGHKAGITAVDVGPATAGAGARFATAARAGSELFTWDLRNTSAALVGEDEGGARGLRPVFKVARQRRREGGEEERKEGWGVFGLLWDEQVGIVSGGADARVQVDR